MAFRFYLATGGLIGYLSQLPRTTLRNAAEYGKSTITLEAPNMTSLTGNVVRCDRAGTASAVRAGLKPAEMVDALNHAGRIGTVTDPPSMATRRPVATRKAESMNAALVAA